MNNWIYGLTAGSFLLGFIMGRISGRRDALVEEANRWKQMQATRMWTEAFAKVIDIQGREVRDGK